jgi:hypothetical protein
MQSCLKQEIPHVSRAQSITEQDTTSRIEEEEAAQLRSFSLVRLAAEPFSLTDRGFETGDI